MRVVESKISPFIESQFPSFYHEEGPNFISFVKSYYQFLESTNNTLYHARKLTEYRDIDTTLQSFISYFQSKYLKDFVFEPGSFDREFIKHAVELYRSKGSFQSLALIFNLLFREQIEVYYPGDDILRSSDGVWEAPDYLELSISDRTKNFIGKNIFGVTSGATAYVQNVVRRNLNGKIIDQCFITNRIGSFLFDEIVRDNEIQENAPRTIGSVSEIIVNEFEEGSNFKVGQTLNIVSINSGKEGLAVVKQTGPRTGDVVYELRDGGFGYTNNVEWKGSDKKVWISTNVLGYTDYVSFFPIENRFIEFTPITQPLTNVVFSNSNHTFAANDYIYGSDSNGDIQAVGLILQTSQTGANGHLLVSPRTFIFADIDNVTNPSTNGSFDFGEVVTQKEFDTSGSNTAYGVVEFANSTTVVLDVFYGEFSDGKILYGNTSGCLANQVSSNLVYYSESNFTNNSITNITVNNTINGANIVSTSNLSVTATLLSSNSRSAGVFGNNRPFTTRGANRVYTNNQTSFICTSISIGDPGGFKIGGIANVESVIINTDVISSNNSGNTNFLSINLDSSNSNAESNTGFGFIAQPAANLQSVIAPCFLNKQLLIGSIISLKELDAGSDNDTSPFVVEIEKPIASFGKYEQLCLHIGSLQKFFSNTEYISQFQEKTVSTISVNSTNGIFNSNVNETVVQYRSDGNTVYGRLVTSDIVSSNGLIVCEMANSSLVFDTSNNIIGVYSNTVANVTSVSSNQVSVEIKADVISSNNDFLIVRRKSFYDFAVGMQIVGSDTGSTANLISISTIFSSNVVGNNAITKSSAEAVDGRILKLDVSESGIGYENKELVYFYPPDGGERASGIIQMKNQARTRGRYKSQRGFLNSDKYLQDNNFYQDYSYQIKSGISAAKYDSIVKSTVHVAGTKRFDAFDKTSINSFDMQPVESPYKEIVTLQLENVSNNFIVNELVSQGNTTTGLVLSYSNTLNTIELFNVVGQFVINSTITGNTSQASANVSSVNIQV